MRALKISIITPSFNQGKFIEQTICSVLDQNYPNLEYIIIDGGSTDNSVEIIKKYEKYIHYWVSEKDKGQSDAINKGLKRATGDIINWLNSDDYYEKDSLFRIAKHFKDPSVECLCGRSIIVDESGTVIKKSSGTDLYDKNLAKTIGWARIDQPETFFRRSVFTKLGGVNEKLHYVMDKDFWIRYLLSFGLKGVHREDDVLVRFRLHGNSKTGSASLKFLEETDELFYSLAVEANLHKEENFIKNFGNLETRVADKFNWSGLDEEIIMKALQYYYLYLADYYYFSGNGNKCALFLKGIHEEVLEREDVGLFKKLKFRNRVMPRFLQKLKHNLL